MDFSIRLLNSVRNLPDEQVKFFRGLQITEEVIKLLCYTCSYTFPELQAVKLTFFAPCFVVPCDALIITDKCA